MNKFVEFLKKYRYYFLSFVYYIIVGLLLLFFFEGDSFWIFCIKAVVFMSFLDINNLAEKYLEKYKLH